MNKATFRFLRHQEFTRSLFLLIPGGPGISGHYMDTFAELLGERQNWDTCILVLPNHENIAPLSQTATWDYENCLQLVRASLEEAAMYYKHIHLVGHSFGARLSLDLLVDCPPSIVSTTLISFPSSLQPSSKFVSASPLEAKKVMPIQTNIDFRKYWQCILPLYFYFEPKKEWIDLLSRNLTWVENHVLVTTTPEIQKNLEAINIPLCLIDGENDLRLPDNHQEWIQKRPSTWKSIVIEKCGHFPMLEAQDRLSSEILSFINESKKPKGD